MSDSPKFNCGCPTGKTCFSSYDLASAEVKRLRRRRRSRRRARAYLAVFRCKICNDWHIGQSEKTFDNRRDPLKKLQIENHSNFPEARAKWRENLRKVTEWLKGRRDKGEGEEG